MQQYTTRLNLEQRLEEAFPLKNITDLKSLSSNDDVRLIPM